MSVEMSHRRWLASQTTAPAIIVGATLSADLNKAALARGPYKDPAPVVQPKCSFVIRSGNGNHYRRV